MKMDHSAKGLEYPIVHILDVNEELMPYKKAVMDADIQEERRMFYVGITRARERLYIHSVKTGGCRTNIFTRSKGLAAYAVI